MTKQVTAAFFAALTRTFKIRLVQAVNSGEAEPARVAFNFIRDGLCEQGMGIKPAAMMAHAVAEFVNREHGNSNYSDADLLDGFRAAVAA